jgi:group I intron endonuclease
MGLIYMATCKVNGKKYIGQTTTKLKARQQQHKWNKRKYYFGKAIDKYGYDNFTWVILRDGILLQEEMDRLEIEMIAKHKTMRPRGYNLTEGGNGGVPCKEVKEKLAARNKARAKAVVCVETGVVYESAREVGKQIGYNSAGITSACLHPTHTRKGLHWRYADESRHQAVMDKLNTSLRIKAEAMAIQKAKTKQKASKWNAEWHNEVAGKKRQREEKSRLIAIEIEKAGSKSAWCRMQAIKAMQDPEWHRKHTANSVDPLPHLIPRCQPKQVVCIETSDVYRSVSHAEKANKISSRGVSHAIKTGGTCHGYHWALVKESEAV